MVAILSFLLVQAVYIARESDWERERYTQKKRKWEGDSVDGWKKKILGQDKTLEISRLSSLYTN